MKNDGDVDKNSTVMRHTPVAYQVGEKKQEVGIEDLVLFPDLVPLSNSKRFIAKHLDRILDELTIVRQELQQIPPKARQAETIDIDATIKALQGWMEGLKQWSEEYQTQTRPAKRSKAEPLSYRKVAD